MAADADALRDERTKVLKAMRSLDPKSVVRGQYRTYRDEPDVDPHSNVETYVALRAEIDSWRWAGVPFLVRAGKCLADDRDRVPRPLPRPAPAALLPGQRAAGRQRAGLPPRRRTRA